MDWAEEAFSGRAKRGKKLMKSRPIGFSVSVSRDVLIARHDRNPLSEGVREGEPASVRYLT